MHYTFPVIGTIHSCFKEKFGIPRQPGLAPLATALLELLPPYDDPAALEGLEGCSHIWLQFVFHANSGDTWKPKVRPPRLGGNKSLGLFATRSPFRPAPIGLSVVKLDAIQRAGEKLFLRLSGIDLLDGTPVLDIKPYLPYADSINNAVNEFASQAPSFVPVSLDASSSAFCAAYQRQTGVDLASLIIQLLRQDPRPSYQKPEADRIYGMKLLHFDLHWYYIIKQDSYGIKQDSYEIQVNSIIDLDHQKHRFTTT